MVRGSINWLKRSHKGLPVLILCYSSVFDVVKRMQPALGNRSAEMDHLNSLLPDGCRPTAPGWTLGPKLHVIWDTALATAEPLTQLAKAFHNCNAHSMVDRIVTAEGYSGSKDSAEYRSIGTGPLLKDAAQCIFRSTREMGPMIHPTIARIREMACASTRAMSLRFSDAMLLVLLLFELYLALWSI